MKMELPARLTLYPLEFQECKVDSPYFRCKLLAHEEALARTSTDIKQLIEELKTVIDAEQHLCTAQRSLANHLKLFHYDCIGKQQTDDEVIIANSLHQFGQLLGDVERERTNMLEFAHKQFIQPLEHFRKDVIGKVKVAKKSYEKASTKFYQSQEKFLSATSKKDDTAVEEMAAALGLEKRQYTIVALDYVKAIQAVHERKKFEFVETLIGFVHSTMCYFRLGYAIHTDYRNFMQDLQLRVQNSRENYNSFCTEADALVTKMLRTSFGTTTATNCSDGLPKKAAKNLLVPAATPTRRQRSNTSLRPPVSQYLMLTPGGVSNVPLNAAGIFNTTIPSNTNQRPSFAEIYGYRFCEGYLLLHDRRKTKISSMTRFVVPPHATQQWSKHYCRYDAATGQLMIRPCSPNSLHHVNAAATTTTTTISSATAGVLPAAISAAAAAAAPPMSIDDDVDAKILHVQQCCIHDPDGASSSSGHGQNVVERRFCFDVYATEPIEEAMVPPASSSSSASFKLNAGSLESSATMNRVGATKSSVSLREGQQQQQTMSTYQPQQQLNQHPTTTTAKGQTNMRILIFQATSNEDRNIWVRTMAESSQHAALLHLSVASQLNNGLTAKRNSVGNSDGLKKKSTRSQRANSSKNPSPNSASPASSSSATSLSKRRQPVPKSLFGNGSNFSDYSAGDSSALVEASTDAENSEVDNDDDDIVDENGIKFIAKCIDAIEKRGLREQGLYRTAGVSSRVNKLLHEYYSLGPNSLNLLHEDQWEVKTITSALKTFLRSLPQPLMTMHLHDKFIEAGKLEDVCERIATVDALVQLHLPPSNRQILAVVIGHLSHVVEFVQYNLMTAANLATCFGPTLMRPVGDTVAALVDIKFANVTVECMIENFQFIFNGRRQQQHNEQQRDASMQQQQPNQRQFYYFGGAADAENQQTTNGNCPPTLTQFLPSNSNSAVNYAALTLGTSKTRRLKQRQSPEPPNNTGISSASRYDDEVNVGQLQQTLSQSSLFSPTSSKDFVLDDFDFDNVCTAGALSPTTSAENSQHSDNRPPSRLTRARNIRYPKRAQPAKTVPLPLQPWQEQSQQQPPRVLVQQQQYRPLAPDLLLSNQAVGAAVSPQHDVHRYNNVSSQLRSAKNAPAPIRYAQLRQHQQPQLQRDIGSVFDFPTSSQQNSGICYSNNHQYAAPLGNDDAFLSQNHQQQPQPGNKINYYSTPFDSTSPYRSIAVSSMTPSTHHLVMAAAESAKHARFASMPMARQLLQQQSTLYYHYENEAAAAAAQHASGTLQNSVLHQKHKSVPNEHSPLHLSHDTSAARLRMFSESQRRRSDSPTLAEAQRRRWTTLILHPFDAASHHIAEIPLDESTVVDVDDAWQQQQPLSVLTPEDASQPTQQRQQKRNADLVFAANGPVPTNSYHLAELQRDEQIAAPARTETYEVDRRHTRYNVEPNHNSNQNDQTFSRNVLSLDKKSQPRKKSPHQHEYQHPAEQSSLSSADAVNAMLRSQLETSPESIHSSPIVTTARNYPPIPFTLRKTPISTVYNFTAGGETVTPTTVIKRRSAGFGSKATMSSARSTPSLLFDRAPMTMAATFGEKGVDFSTNNDLEIQKAESAGTPSNTLTATSAENNVQLKKYTHHGSDDDEDSANADDERRDSLSPPQIALKRHQLYQPKSLAAVTASEQQHRNGSGSNMSSATASSLSNTLSSSASSVASLYDQHLDGKIRRRKEAAAPDSRNSVVDNDNLLKSSAVEKNPQPAAALYQHIIQEFQLHDI